MAAFTRCGIPEVYLGLSTDTKPSSAPPDSRCYEIDTGIEYITRDGTTWVVYAPAKYLADDAPIVFGGVAKLLWETADANANALLLALPNGGATDVPVFVIGDQGALNVDLGLFNGITQPRIAVVDHAATSAVSLGFTGAGAAAIILQGSAVLTLPALTLSGAITGNSQNITGVGLLDANSVGIRGSGICPGDGIFAYYSETSDFSSDVHAASLAVKHAATAGAFGHVTAGINGEGRVGPTNNKNWTTSPIGLCGIGAAALAEAGATGIITGAADFYAGLYASEKVKGVTITDYYGLYTANPQTSDGGVITNYHPIYCSAGTIGGTSNWSFIGGKTTLGAAVASDSVLHLYEASAGAVTADANSLLTLEDGGDGTNSWSFITFLGSDTCSNETHQGLLFGDTSDNDAGYFKYEHREGGVNTGKFIFGIDGSKRLLYSAGAFAFQEATTISSTGTIEIDGVTSVGINYNKASDLYFSGGPSCGTGRLFKMGAPDAATGVGNVASSAILTLGANYRNGSNAVTGWDVNIQHVMDSAAGGTVPISHLLFSINSVEVMRLTNTNGTVSMTSAGLLTATGYKVGANQVVGARVVDARLADTPNSGDATTDGLIDALRDLVISHGLGAAS